ncbi:winged helix-turn-helix transcriptional regulator [Brucella intermedia]|jgi:DNA-binding transcriptional ArsR family regulator|uniref:ArsR family transcriptional regulator n=6 Tax=Brucella TaxID=234 RepID=U4V7T2_9HYPH|nr:MULTISPECIES: metalloregulator ArsR/SmtB family transcription factor [Brucella/Ochrobactrum group]ERI13970.1 ArsR family transcriptional regulator [Ochrobactrum sp. EGD-AQ16]ERM00739.1 ArsR family transcriptional regulator [Brucella intermedia 229E]KAB2669107.1 winged helix-turn-helix transcriptional regulator [Ochrobactrum sp. LMG 5442]PJR94153.1 ArsR family transcriptional regulator [Ochrobactrum sp. 721/2009]PJT17435.1 ArsR family transcriptional regulator [Ochrobactrum sp. 720/2009]PJT
MSNQDTFFDLIENVDQAADFLSALANNKRLLILCKLLHNEMSVGALAKAIDLSQSALSQHLAKLRALDLVSTRRDAQTIYYMVSSPHIELMLSTLSSLYMSPTPRRHNLAAVAHA